MTKHQGQTDQINRIELPSTIQQVQWTAPMAPAGGLVVLEIFTHYVGNNAEVSIQIKDDTGKTVGDYKGKIAKSYFSLDVAVPEKTSKILTAKVELPKHGLQKESAPLRVIPPIQITNAKWSQSQARRGDILKLTAEVKTVPDGTEGEIEIWEFDHDDAHDLITKFPVLVNKGKVEAEWEFEYHEDTDDIPTQEELEKYGKNYNPPEYFFRVWVKDVFADSGLLEFKDWIEIELVDADGNSIPQEEYVLYLLDGSERRGKLDENGFARVEDVPPGPCRIIFPNLK